MPRAYRFRIRFHASGPSLQQCCVVDGGNLPRWKCPKCRQTPDDMLESLMRRLEDLRQKKR